MALMAAAGAAATTVLSTDAGQDWLNTRLSSPDARNQERAERAARLYNEALQGNAASLAELIRLAEHFATAEGKEYARAYLRQYYTVTGTIPDARVASLISWTGQSATSAMPPVRSTVPAGGTPTGYVSTAGAGSNQQTLLLAAVVAVALYFATR